MTRPQLTIVTNIPAPYRLHSFAILHDELQRRDLGFEVMFMASTEQGRYWETDAKRWQFPGRVLSGIHPRFRSVEMHINPSIWHEIVKSPPRWLLVGGSWIFPTSLGLLALHPLLRHTKVLIWTEANFRAYQNKSQTYRLLRRQVLRLADGFVIPGDVALQTLVEYERIRNPGCVFLPNLVDETIYRDRVQVLRDQKGQLRSRYRIPDGHRVLFWPARLREGQKGILNFLNAICMIPQPHVTIAIAGDGSDRECIEQWILAHRSLNVRLLGHISEDEVVEWLALSDLMLLPSIRDPNPLSVIEAIWASLPLMISMNCGNWPETIHDGGNGWLVDPHKPEDLRHAFRGMMACTDDDLRLRGEKSLTLATENFSSQQVVARFVDELLVQFPA